MFWDGLRQLVLDYCKYVLWDSFKEQAKIDYQRMRSFWRWLNA